MSIPQRVTEAFHRILGGAPTLLVRAPGRVNLIGEHTDYNDGFVLPMAISRAVWIALSPRTDRRVVVHSLDFGETLVVDLARVERGRGWGEYIKGVAWALEQAGSNLRGWQGVVAGDVPIGAGLSSSAALELAVARAFAEVSRLTWAGRAMALLAQRAEREWVGVPCGIMDQLISAVGRAGHALLIDCRTLETRYVPLPDGVSVVVMDTGTRRRVSDSAYQERRRECSVAAQRLGVSSLRDLSEEQLTGPGNRLSGSLLRRARHVISENARTLAAAEAMVRGDAGTLGSLMDASHRSLRDDYQVSSPELDAIVACAWRESACLGARLTGAGFGGCAIALVRSLEVEEFTSHVTAAYAKMTGLTPSLFVCAASEGADVSPIG
jgi:galactokinase